MGLLDDLTNAPPSPVYSRCRFCAIADSLPDDESAVLKDAIVQKKLGNQALADILTKNGHPISETAIRRHRRHGV